mgnify:CR=1 FL=1
MKRKAPYNSTHPKGGAPCSADSFVVADNSVLRINICAEKIAHRQSAKRQLVARLLSVKSELYILAIVFLFFVFPFRSNY